METPDQYVHHANQAMNHRGEECEWKPESTVFKDSRGCRPAPRRADARSTARNRPQTPAGGFSPPVPQGSGGNQPTATKPSPPRHANHRPKKSVEVNFNF
jgi:hypothetical protein